MEYNRDEKSSGVNQLNVQLHNNKIAQLKWENSAGYNMLNAAIFLMTQVNNFSRASHQILIILQPPDPMPFSNFRRNLAMTATEIFVWT